MTRVFWHALVFGLAPILQKLVSLVLLPLYTHYLTAADYGEIELLTIITGLFGVVLRLELRHGYMRAWIVAEDDPARAALFRVSLGVLVALGAAGAAVFLAACGLLCDTFLGYRIGWGFQGVLALGLFADVVALVCNATMQARLQSAMMVSLGVAQFAVSAGLTILFVVGFHMGAIGFFVGGTVSSLLGLLTMLVLLRSLLRGRAGTPPDMPAILRYSMPLLGGALLFFVVRNADRIAVSQFVSVAGLGIYAMAWTLANLLLNVVFTPIQTSFDVWRYEMHQQGGRAGEVAAFFRAAMLVIGIGAMGLDTFGADAFVFFADRRFAAAVAYLPLLSAAVLLQAGYAFLSAAFYVTGATGRWLRIFSGGAALQVVLSLVLVPWLGIAGAAVSIALSNLLLYVGAAHWGRALWPVPYPHGRVAALVTLVLALSGARVWMQPGTLGAALAADAVVCALFGALLFPLGVIAPSDLATVRRLISGRVLAARLRVRRAVGRP